MAIESTNEQSRTNQLVGVQTRQHVPGFSRELEFILFLCVPPPHVTTYFMALLFSDSLPHPPAGCCNSSRNDIH